METNNLIQFLNACTISSPTDKSYINWTQFQNSVMCIFSKNPIFIEVEAKSSIYWMKPSYIKMLLFQ